MKQCFKTILLITIVLNGITIFCQSPEKISYQAVIRNSNNQLIINSIIGIKVSILESLPDGLSVYEETHTIASNENGLITIQIGGGQILSGDFSNIEWGQGLYFLKTEIDPNGHSNYSIVGIQQFLSVPYALFSKKAENGFSGNYNDLINTPTIPEVPVNVGEFINDAGYITMDSIPNNISSFNNDANYLTQYQMLNINIDTIFLTNGGFIKLPEVFSGNYNDLINTPTIPEVPVNVGEFINDAGYITMDSMPYNISSFNNDANYLTQYQMLSINNDTVFLTNGGYIKLPNGFSGNYNDLNNKPTIPEVPENIGAFTNDVGYITMDSIPNNISSFNNDANYLTQYQMLSINIDTIFLTNGGFIKLPEGFSGNYNDLINKPTIPEVPVNLGAFTNDVGYLTQSEFNTQMHGNNSGDILFWNGINNEWEILPIGLQGQILTINNGIPSWETPIIQNNIKYIKFEANGGIGNMNIQFFPIGMEQAINNNTYIRNGFVFEGWNTDSMGLGTFYSNQQLISLSESITLYAQWNIITYTITFNSNGGSGIMTNQTFQFGISQNLLTNSFIRTNCNFINWNTSYNGNGISYNNEQLITLSENLILYAQWVSLDSFPCIGVPTAVDHQGNIYNTVQIGTQCWLRENMRCTTSPTGISWTCNPYSNTNYLPYYATVSSSNYLKGKLYNWTAAMNLNNYYDSYSSQHRGICPIGWHIPSENEWTTLINYLGGLNVAGGKMISTTASDQTSNESGFSSPRYVGYYAKDAGYGGFLNETAFTLYWSSTQSGSYNAYSLIIGDSGSLSSNYWNKCFGLSVRCIKN